MDDMKITQSNSETTQARTYRVEDIAEILEISMTSAYSLVRKKQFKVVRIGNAIRVSRKSFDTWLDGLDD